LRESRAGTQRRPSFPGRPPLAMVRQVNWALYGRCDNNKSEPSAQR
jgi:hypothetical protein